MKPRNLKTCSALKLVKMILRIITRFFEIFSKITNYVRKCETKCRKMSKYLYEKFICVIIEFSFVRMESVFIAKLF